MKKTIKLLTIVFVILFTLSATGQKPIPKLVDRSKTGITSYLKTVIKNKQVIVGQQCSDLTDWSNDYKKYFKSLFDSTGKYPGLIGLEYGWYADADLVKINQVALEQWNKGGLVTICWHADCPFNDGYNVRFNASQKKDSIDLKMLFKNAPASKEKTNYRTELVKVAVALKQLKEAGVTVLWRPFHEANGTWFWWGVNDRQSPTNQQDFIALWKDMYETFTKDFGLDNLLWVYSPSSTQGNVWPSLSSIYPGNNYVDIVGADIYPKVPEFPDYNDLKTFKKIIVNGEIGPAKESHGSFDELEILNIHKGKAAYFLQWPSWKNAKVAIIENAKYKEMMNDPAAITLDKLK